MSWRRPGHPPSTARPGGEWRTYGGDLGSTRYAPLDQIDGSNFNDLEVAWRFKTENFGPGPDFNYQTTPLMVDGVLYATAGSRRNAVALDAATGELLWMYRLDEGERGANALRRMSGRGVAYWTDGAGDERIYLVTIGYQLVALDARTGIPVPAFGENGIVDLKQHNDQAIDPLTGEIGWNSAPIVARDTVVVGASHRGGSAPPSRENIKGYIRGFDARTGERKWIFHTIPTANQFGRDTWLNDSAVYTGNTGVWTNLTVDEELGIAYLPVEIPTGDYYGGHRPGDNLFSESLVAVDLETGERKWHFQFVHHPIWDYDVPCPPILVDITVDGRDIAAVAQPTKQGWVFVFDRLTGEPVWPIEERPVEQGNVPGEWYSPTQPFPTKPPPFERQGFPVEELIDFTPELHAEALEFIAQFKVGPVYTPPIVQGQDGQRATLFVPNGANWPGGSWDPESGILYLYSHTLMRALGLVNDPSRSDMDYINGRAGSLTVRGLPLLKPPWGRITGDRSERGRDRLADRARRDSRPRAESPVAARARYSADRTDRRRRRQFRRDRNADDEDPRHQRRGRDHHAGGRNPGRDASGLRQGVRGGTGCGPHSGRADRLAYDLPARRAAVHRPRRRWRHLPRRADRVPAAGECVLTNPVHPRSLVATRLPTRRARCDVRARRRARHP